jgi:hypothetical protein
VSSSLRRPDRPDLEEVIHHGEEVEPGVIGRARDGRQVRTEPGRPAREREVRDLYADLHAIASRDSLRRR